VCGSTAKLRAEFSDLDEIFLEPVPRNDPDLRARVRARYGPDRLRMPEQAVAKPTDVIGN